jgi:hypothetical protein
MGPLPVETIARRRVHLMLASRGATNIRGAEIVVDDGMSGAPSGAPIHRD